MLVLCHEDGTPAMEGDKIRLLSGDAGTLQSWGTPGSALLLVATPDGIAWIPCGRTSLTWVEKPDPVLDELTVKDRYVLALLPIIATGCSASRVDAIIEHAFRAADKCMERRK